MLDFLKENINFIWPLGIFLLGWLLPTPKFFKLGQKAAESIPPQLAKLIAERLRAFEKGLLEENFRGDKTIIGNTQFKDGVKGLKMELGLEDLKLKEEE